MSAIAVIGLGAMGSRMAANWARAGHEVTVWNRTDASAQALAHQHSISVAASVEDAASAAEVVVVMVADDDASREVWIDRGGFDAMMPSAVAIESSTITPRAARRLGDGAAERGIALLEAPVVGSRPQLEAGGLLYLVAGDPKVLDHVQPIIEVNAGAVRHVGRHGTAAELKLAINTLFAIQVAAYAEIVGVLERAEIDTAAALEILGALPITSPGLQRILGLIASRNFDPNFPVELVAKDLRYAAELARSLDAEAPLTITASTVFSAAAAGSLGDLDIAGIAAAYQR